MFHLPLLVNGARAGLCSTSLAPQQRGEGGVRGNIERRIKSSLPLSVRASHSSSPYSSVFGESLRLQLEHRLTRLHIERHRDVFVYDFPASVDLAQSECRPQPVDD